MPGRGVLYVSESGYLEWILTFRKGLHMEDDLKIVYDKGADNGDKTCMIVMRECGTWHETIKVYYGKEADELYEKLVNGEKKV